MSIEPQQILATGTAVALFAAVFLVGGRIHPLRHWVHDRRNIISFGSGVAIAYVFMQVMPDIHIARQDVAQHLDTPYEGMAIYFFALLGFLLSYSLEHFRERKTESHRRGQVTTAFKIHIGGFSAYVWLMAYLLVRRFDEPGSLAPYVAAIAFHFLAMDHSLDEEHAASYRRYGRFVLAFTCLLGWITGLLLPLPPITVALLVSFISGAIIMNSSIAELPTEKDGRFWPFVIGGVSYALILLPLG